LDRCDQFSQILDCRNEQILDRLLDKSSPTGTLKTVKVRGICKTAFDQRFEQPGAVSGWELSPTSRIRGAKKIIFVT
jgi:hypothetical protein